MIFDAGVFIALDNPAQREVVVALIERLGKQKAALHTTEAVLAQAWRDPARQAVMSRLVKTTTVLPFGDSKTIGIRCARTGTSDVVDADLAIWSEVLGETILTTDAGDMTKLGARHVALHP
jgi:hypothetical protein